MLMELMGHKKLQTTQRYYLSTENGELVKRTKNLLNEIYQPREIELEDGTKMITMPANPYYTDRFKRKLKHTPQKQD